MATEDTANPFTGYYRDRLADHARLRELIGEPLAAADPGERFADVVERLAPDVRAEVQTLMAVFAPEGILDLGNGQRVRIDRPTPKEN